MRWTEADLLVYQTRQSTGAAYITPSDAALMPEETLLQRVRALAKRYGFLSYHTRDSRRSDEGWPDLFLTNGKRLVAIECKSATGKLTEKQALWLEMLRQTGKVETYVLRPADLPHIEAILRGDP